jgi:hypothetical protein
VGRTGGVFENGQYSLCSECGDGKFKGVVGDAACQTCGGTVDWDAQALPTTALPFLGTVDHDKDPTTACTACNGAGRYSVPAYTMSDAALQGSNVPCPLCPSGKEDHDSSPATACKPCQPGQFSQAGQTSCTSCERGLFDDDYCLGYNADGDCTSTNPNSAQTPCAQCVAGKVAPFLKMTACDVCEPGKFTDSLNVMCQPCPAGWYDHDAGGGSAATPCLLCMAGHKTNLPENAVECSECFSGYFAASNGSVLCSRCDVGTFAADAAVICDDCQQGYADKDSEPATECAICSAVRATAPRAGSLPSTTGAPRCGDPRDVSGKC